MIYFSNKFSLQDLPSCNLLGTTFRIKAEVISRSDVREILQENRNYVSMNPEDMKSDLGIETKTGLSAFTLIKGDTLIVMETSPFVQCWKITLE